MSYASKLAAQLEDERLSILAKLNRLGMKVDIKNIVLIVAPLDETINDFKVYVIKSSTYTVLGSFVITCGAFVHFKLCKELMQYKNIFVNKPVKNPLKIFSISQAMDKVCGQSTKNSNKAEKEVTELYRSKEFYREKEKSIEDVVGDRLQGELNSILYEESAMKDLKKQEENISEDVCSELPFSDIKDIESLTEMSEEVKCQQVEKSQFDNMPLNMRKEKLNEKVEILYLSESFEKEDIGSLLAQEAQNSCNETATQVDNAESTTLMVVFFDEENRSENNSLKFDMEKQFFVLNRMNGGEVSEKSSDVCCKSIQCSPTVLNLAEPSSMDKLVQKNTKWTMDSSLNVHGDVVETELLES